MAPQLGLPHPGLPFGLDSQFHAALFYSNKDFLLQILCDFFLVSLKAGHGALIVATEAHRELIAQALGRCGINISRLKSEGIYLEIDSEKTLSDCTAGGTVNTARMNQTIGRALATNQATAPASCVMVFAEMVALLWQRRDIDNLLVVEKFWGTLTTHSSFSLLCGYPIREFVETGTEDAFVKICAQHSIVIPPDEYPSPEAEKRILRATARKRAKLK